MQFFLTKNPFFSKRHILSYVVFPFAGSVIGPRVSVAGRRSNHTVSSNLPQAFSRADAEGFVTGVITSQTAVCLAIPSTDGLCSTGVLSSLMELRQRTAASLLVKNSFIANDDGGVFGISLMLIDIFTAINQSSEYRTILFLYI